MVVHNLRPRITDETKLMRFDEVPTNAFFYLLELCDSAEPGWYEKTGIGEARPVDTYLIVKVFGNAWCYKK